MLQRQVNVLNEQVSDKMSDNLPAMTPPVAA